MDADNSVSGPSLPNALDRVRISCLPSAAYYISDFITEDEEQAILQRVASAPKPRWKQLRHRRLQTWPSDLVNNKLIDAPLPTWLEEPIVSRLKTIPLELGTEGAHVFHDSPHQRPNHVLINEYPPGVGIMAHKDGSAYHPVVCTVSLGASLCLNIHKSREDGTLDTVPAWRILQEPRSLLITTAELYCDYLHGIADAEEDSELSAQTIANWSLLRSSTAFQHGQNLRGVRTSLTFRDVINVSKLGNKLRMFRTR
ncbi:Alkbh6 protein [Xylariomycetidae sp. FL0641]|nr:Alkbh6 protein [Xylariomycetidae sp. FL0641]